MYGSKRYTWILICVLLAVVWVGMALYKPSMSVAQTRSTPTRPLPPPERTKPPAERATPTTTPSPVTPAPPAPPREPTPTATPTLPAVMPITGHLNAGGQLLLFSAALIGLGVLALAWSVGGHRRNRAD